MLRALNGNEAAKLRIYRMAWTPEQAAVAIYPNDKKIQESMRKNSPWAFQ